MNTRQWIFLMVVIGMAGSVPARANVEELKLYKKAFPEDKPRCLYCHVDEKPKKEDGKHDLNPYGAKVKELGKDAGVEKIQALGPSDQGNNTEESTEQK